MFVLHTAQRRWLSILSSQLSHPMNSVLMLSEFSYPLFLAIFYVYVSFLFPFSLPVFNQLIGPNKTANILFYQSLRSLNIKQTAKQLLSKAVL